MIERAGWPGPRVAVVAFALLLAVVALGPRPRLGVPPGPPELPADLDAYLSESERAVPGIRTGARKEIVWAGPAGERTSLAIVYLHGFSADRHEIDPVPRRVAESLEANLYYARLAGHGGEGSALAEVRASDWLGDVEEALAIGRRIGERVVVVGTSTGGTLAVWGAAQPRWQDDLAALVLVSPNFHPKDRTSRVLLWPWGGLLARLVIGGERCFEPANAEQAVHWTTCYPTRALLPMMALVEEVRTMDLTALGTPVLVLHGLDDQVVDLDETRRVFATLPARIKRMEAVEDSDDPYQHVVAGRMLSPASSDTVVERIVEFVSSVSTAAATR